MAAKNAEFAETVRTLIPIRDLTPDAQEEAWKAGKVLKLRPDRYVFRQGDRDEFAFYLLQGELELEADGQLVKRVVGDSEAARVVLSQLQPRQLSARTVKPSVIFRIRRDELGQFASANRAGGATSEQEAQVHVSEAHETEETDWMSRMLQSQAFSRLPAANIQQLFASLRPLELGAGEVVVEEGTPGDYYYVIQEGRCEVTRKQEGEGSETKLAELGPGDGFGEEALVSNRERNATVKMLTAGVLMRLGKEDFLDLIKDPIVSSVGRDMGERMVSDGAIWLDVRSPDEHRQHALPASVNIPLTSLRSSAGKLDRGKRYVVCCDTGARSAAAAFLLVQQGFDACYVEGGVSEGQAESARSSLAGPTSRAGSPAASGPRDEARPLPDAAGRHKRRPRSERVAASKAGGGGAEQGLRHQLEHTQGELQRAREEAQRLREEVESAKQAAHVGSQPKGDKSHMEAEVAQTAEELKRVQRMRDEAEQRLKAEQAALEKRHQDAERRLAEAMRLKAIADAEREAQKEAFALQIQESMRTNLKKLEEEGARADQAMKEVQRLKAEVEAAKKAAEAERARKQEQEQELQRVKEATERRLREEERRLQDQYFQHQEELERIRKEKEAAERRVHDEREALKAEAEAAERRVREARAIQEQIEAARSVAEKEVEAKQKELAGLEQRMRAERDKLDGRVQTLADREREQLQREFDRKKSDALKALEQQLRAEQQQMAKQLEKSAAAERRELEQDRERLEVEYAQNKKLALKELERQLRAEQKQAVEQVERSVAIERQQLEAKYARNKEDALKDLEQQLRNEQQSIASQMKSSMEDERRQLEQERRRLETSYANNKKSALQRLKQRLKKEQKSIAKQMQHAVSAEREKLESERHQLEAQYQRDKERALKQLEQRMREEQATLAHWIEESMAEERKQLEVEFKRNKSELGQALADREAAENARQMAEAEVARVKSEYRAALRKAITEEQEKVRAERAQLEAESVRVQSMLAEAKRAKEEAEAARKAAAEQADQRHSARNGDPDEVDDDDRVIDPRLAARLRQQMQDRHGRR